MYVCVFMYVCVYIPGHRFSVFAPSLCSVCIYIYIYIYIYIIYMSMYVYVCLYKQIYQGSDFPLT